MIFNKGSFIIHPKWYVILRVSADIWIRMQLQQWGDGAVSDRGEAAANPDEAAQGEHAHTFFSGKVFLHKSSWGILAFHREKEEKEKKSSLTKATLPCRSFSEQ